MNARTGYLWSAIFLLALFALLGVRSSLAMAAHDLDAGQRAVSLLQWSYAILAALAILGLLARHRGTRLVLLAWGALFITRNALVPVYLGGKGVALALAGGVIGLIIGGTIFYLGLQALPPHGAPTTAGDD